MSLVETKTYEHRTIGKSYWEIVICAFNGLFVKRKQYLSANGSRVIKEVIVKITELEYHQFISKNQSSLIKSENRLLFDESFYADIDNLLT